MGPGREFLPAEDRVLPVNRFYFSHIKHTGHFRDNAIQLISSCDSE